MEPEKPRASLGLEGEAGAVGDLEVLGGVERAPSAPKTCGLTAKGLQLVGLRAKSGRLRLTRIARRRRGMPWKIWGRESETAVTWAVSGLMWRAARTTTLPRS